MSCYLISVPRLISSHLFLTYLTIVPHLVLSHFISSYFILSHLISTLYLISSSLISTHLFLSHYILLCPILFCLVSCCRCSSSHLLLSQLFLFHCISFISSYLIVVSRLISSLLLLTYPATLPRLIFSYLVLSCAVSHLVSCFLTDRGQMCSRCLLLCD